MHFRRVTAGDPFTHATSTVAPSGEEGVAPSRVHDILVIEDDPSTSQMLQLMLQDEGYTVDVAPDGDEGLALLQHRRYRLLLLDLMLPGLDGLGALRAEPALRPPVVVVL